MRQRSEIRGQRSGKRALVLALAVGLLAAGCAGPRVVFVPSAEAPVRAGPDVSGRVYVWTGTAWELSGNSVNIPEGCYIWDAGDKTPAPMGK